MAIVINEFEAISEATPARAATEQPEAENGDTQRARPWPLTRALTTKCRLRRVHWGDAASGRRRSDSCSPFLVEWLTSRP